MRETGPGWGFQAVVECWLQTLELTCGPSRTPSMLDGVSPNACVSFKPGLQVGAHSKTADSECSQPNSLAPDVLILVQNPLPQTPGSINDTVNNLFDSYIV
jgi:hypothetical protein